MKNKLEMQWLKSKGIVLDTGFVEAIKALSQNYKKAHNIKNVEKVYDMLGIKKQYLSYWEQNPYSVRSKKNFAIL